ncbi:MAG TPA: putative Ig domain-containing protein, partial [Blastocatellia bacterium]|nr:putative Ig domain-containing protein [Blastocatellia bacterium]
FSVIQDPVSGVRFVVRNSPPNSVQVLGQSSRGPITNRMELAAYSEMVRGRLSANRRAAREFEARAFAGIPVLEWPAGYIAETQRGELEAQFHFWNPPIRWFEPDDGQSVSFKVNTDGAPAQVSNTVIAAANAWSTVVGSTLRVSGDGTADTCGLFALDGVNSISFNNCDGYFSGSGNCSAGVLAVTSIANYDRSQSRVVNGVTFYRAIEANLTFNPFASCSFTDPCQLQEIMTHEMGHGLGLHHSWDSSFGGTPSLSDQEATMYWVAHFDGRCASLRQDDMNGITAIYPATGGGPGPLTIVSSPPLGTSSVGTLFSRQLLASGGTTPYVWSLISGSLPEGLGLSSSGLVLGTPTTTGTFDFTVRVTDAANATADKALAITIVAQATGYDSQYVSQNVPSTLQPNQAFVVTIRWLNTGTTVWDGGGGFAIISQNPEGNVVWGGNTVPWLGQPVSPGGQMELVFQAFAPGTAGFYNFQWRLHQQNIGFFGDASENVNITVGDPVPPPPLSIGGSSSFSAVKGAPFTNTLPATGGYPSYSWQLAAGGLPGGISLNSTTGTLAGTPTAPGSFAFTVQVTDSRSQTAQKGFTFTITEAGPPVPPVEITTSTLPAAAQGVGFNQQLSATGGKPPYTWKLTAGALPNGLNLASATGIISGTPGTVGSSNFTVTATDSESRTASKTLSINVSAPPLLVATVPALETLMGLSFSYQLVATGGTAPYMWSVGPGALPAGLELHPTSGLISGTPWVSGLFAFPVTVRDASSVTATATVQIKVIDPATIPSIRKIKYKKRKKLLVVGERFSPNGMLLLDGNQISFEMGDGQLVVKPIAIASGRHEIRVVNPGDVSSATFVWTLQ